MLTYVLTAHTVARTINMKVKSMQELSSDLVAYSDGVLVGPEPQEHYWGEIGKDDFQALHDFIENHREFSVAVQEYFETHPRKDLFPYITDIRGRNSWYELLSLQSTTVAVDLGAGLGAISEFLSSRFRRVYAVEGCRERCSFLAMRNQKKGLENICVIHNSIYNLPFKERSIDLVVCNGILEWAALGTEGSVFEIQLKLLIEIGRVLKDDGVLYIGIENRFGRQYFHGSPDHTGTKYTSLMPRWCANFVTMHRHRKFLGNFWFYTDDRSAKYRTYTYSIIGYRNLLSRAGLSHNKFFCVEPSYDIPRFSYPWDVQKGVMKEFKSIFLQEKFGGLREKFFCSNFFIFSSKKDLASMLKTEPIFFGYRETLTVGDGFILRTDSRGLACRERIVSGIPVLSGKLAHVTTQQVIDAYTTYLSIGGTHEAKADPADLLYTLSLLCGRYLADDLLMTLGNEILNKHFNMYYHGDFWIGNLVLREDSQVSLVDSETQGFGSCSLDIVDFIMDFSMHKRQHMFPLIDPEAIARYFHVSMEDQMLVHIAILRQVLRYSSFHRSNSLFYVYLDLLRRHKVDRSGRRKKLLA